jgi:hypothetical protein
VKLSGAALTTLQGANGGAAVEFFAQPVGSSAGLITGSPGYSLYLSATNAATFNGSSGLSTSNTTTAAAANRAAVTWGTSYRAVALNAGTVASDTNSFGSVGSTVNLGAYAGNYLSSYLRSLAIYNQRLPDTILKAKSAVGASY